MIRTMEEINNDRLIRPENALGRIVAELDELEAMAGQLQALRNRLLDKANNLYTSDQVWSVRLGEDPPLAASGAKHIERLEKSLNAARADIRRLTGIRDTLIAEKNEAREGRGAARAEAARYRDEMLRRSTGAQVADAVADAVAGKNRAIDRMKQGLDDAQGWMDLLKGELASANAQRDQARARVVELERMAADRLDGETSANQEIDRLKARINHADVASLERELAETRIERNAAWARVFTMETLVGHVNQVVTELPARPPLVLDQSIWTAIARVRQVVHGWEKPDNYVTKLEELLQRAVDHMPVVGADQAALIDEIRQTIGRPDETGAQA